MYLVTLLDPDRLRFWLDADNARVTGYHIVFYKTEDKEEVLVASFFLTDVEEVMDVARVTELPDEQER